MFNQDVHGFYLRPFTTGTATFVAADNYADLIVGAFPFSATVDAAEITTLSGRRISGDRTITADNQTVRFRVFHGEAKHTLLFNRLVTRPSAPDQGEPLAFLRSYPDYIAIAGRARLKTWTPSPTLRPMPTVMTWSSPFPTSTGWKSRPRNDADA